MPHQSDALEAQGCYQVESTTVLPVLPSRHDCLSNRWSYSSTKPKPLYIAGLSLSARKRLRWKAARL